MDGVKVRKPVYAGSFYPEDAETLRFAVNQYIDAAEVNCDKCRLKAVISPHAGYIYSGYTAGYSYKVVQKCAKGFSGTVKVFLLGPSHKALVEGMVVSGVDEWHTPFGSVAVSDVAKELTKNEELFSDIDQAHLQEHSLEVQLPFIHLALPSHQYEIIPILCSDLDYKAAAQLVNKYLDDNSLIVVSTDLSHYQPYDIANAKDKKTIDAILNLDSELFIQDGDVCGKMSVLMLIELAKMNSWKVNLAHYNNSGDAVGDKSAVVGYASMYFCA